MLISIIKLSKILQKKIINKIKNILNIKTKQKINKNKLNN